MTQDERLIQVALALALGRVIPYYGVIPNATGDGMRCECYFHKTCTSPGKHPRFGKGCKKDLTQDFDQILAWARIYPHTNFGMTTLPNVFAIDYDYRPEQGKFGIEELSGVKGYNQKEMEDTIRVGSGRNEQSGHGYFGLPAGVDIRTLRSPNPGIELKKGANIMTAGCRHVSGREYRFFRGCSPGERELGMLPDWFIDHLTIKIEPSAYRVAKEAQAAKDPFRAILKPEAKIDLREPIAPGRKLPDFVVLEKGMRNDGDGALSLFNARHREHRDLSVDIYNLARKLAFYTNHHWQQYHELCLRSPLIDLPHKANKTDSYLEDSLLKAFVENRENWQDATGNKKLGRCRSVDTQTVLALLEKDRDLTSREIANRTKLPMSKVKQIIYRAKGGFFHDE